MTGNGVVSNCDGPGMFLMSEIPETKTGLKGLRSRFSRKDDGERWRNAIVKKNGHYRVNYDGLSSQKSKFLSDIYVTMIDLKWRYVISIVFATFFITYFVFGVLWWLSAYNHGDFDNLDNSDFTPCLYNVKGFFHSILFSIEIQTTIGYGIQYPNPECFASISLMYLQVTIGFLCETIAIGIIFVKIARPKHRGKTLLFSKCAVICQQNGEIVLQVRIGDMRQSHLVSSHVHGVLVRRHVTSDGYVYPLYQHLVEFESHGMGDELYLIWPVIITHRITETSPLWNIKPYDLQREKYELIVYVEGTIESTGEVCQARTSYTPREVLWGHRFERIENFDEGNKRWHVDFQSFNDVIYCNNIRNSAQELSEVYTNVNFKNANNKQKSLSHPHRIIQYDLPPPEFTPSTNHVDKEAETAT